MKSINADKVLLSSGLVRSLGWFMCFCTFILIWSELPMIPFHFWLLQFSLLILTGEKSLVWICLARCYFRKWSDLIMMVDHSVCHLKQSMGLKRAQYSCCLTTMLWVRVISPIKKEKRNQRNFWEDLLTTLFPLLVQILKLKKGLTLGV